jgi:hypothetical protein
MSKLSDAIRRTMRSEAAPMGFGAARAAPKATMLVGAFGSAATGADVVVLDGRNGGVSPAAIEKARAGDNGIVVGLRAASIDREQIAELRKAGLGFLLFEPETTPAAALLEEELGYVMALPPQPDTDFLRTLGPLNLDAFYLEDVPSPLTVARQKSVSG